MPEAESTILSKICTKCKQPFPATTEYFYRHSNGGLQPRCKPCHNESNRPWAQNNKARRAATEKTRRDKNREVCRANDRARYAKDPEKINAYKRLWRANNPTKTAEYSRRYFEKNPEKRRAGNAANRRKNNHKYLVHTHNYVARKRGLPAAYTNADWQRAKQYWGYACAICSREEGFEWTLAQDHFVPLSDPRCLGTVPDNILPLCHGVGGCNNSKHNRDPEAWLREKLGPRRAKKKLAEIHAFFVYMREGGVMLTTQYTYEMRPFHPDDLLLIPMREQERQFWAGMDLHHLGQSKLLSPSKTLLADGIPIVLYGMQPIWQGLHYLWSFFAVHAYAHRWYIWRALQQEWTTWRTEHPEMRRTEALTLADDPPAHRLMQHLDFQVQSCKVDYGPRGEPFWEWVWLRSNTP